MSETNCDTRRKTQIRRPQERRENPGEMVEGRSHASSYPTLRLAERQDFRERDMGHRRPLLHPHQLKQRPRRDAANAKRN